MVDTRRKRTSKASTSSPPSNKRPRRGQTDKAEDMEVDGPTPQVEAPSIEPTVVRVGKPHGPMIDLPAPAFECKALLPSGEFGDIKLKDLEGKWVALLFYGQDFTESAKEEMAEFSSRAAEFEKAGCTVVGCSADSHYTHLAWYQRELDGKLKFPLLADIKQEVSQNYGMVDVEEFRMTRGVFLIGPEQNVRGILLHNSAKRNAEEVLRLMKS
ncbi:uncharacterized protein VTP21DRAFT_2454 [Calcarisporiella thermophila]|uniref:uncharacterized protein n=1 Tax=Calcarisporiella thermophila TaxID=911321 RepID=UPI0037433686